MTRMVLNEAFNRFDDAHRCAPSKSIKKLSEALGQTRHAAALEGLVVGSVIFSILMVLNTYLGLRPRIQEYQIESYLHKRNLRKQLAEVGKESSPPVSQA